MGYLNDQGYRCLSLADYLNSCGHFSPWGKKAFVLTFDDGSEDFFTLAYPILRRFDFTATMFLVTH